MVIEEKFLLRSSIPRISGNIIKYNKLDGENNVAQHS